MNATAMRSALAIGLMLAAALVLGAFVGLTPPVPASFDGSTEPPLLRRAVIAVLGLVGAFALTLRGWDSIDRNHRLYGAALIAGGWLLALAGFSLLRLTDQPSTWSWWL